jgi:hypothetical protein
MTGALAALKERPMALTVQGSVMAIPMMVMHVVTVPVAVSISAKFFFGMIEQL